MRRSLPTAVTVVVGLLLLADFVVVNPSLAAVADALLAYVVVLAAAAALVGGVALAGDAGARLLRGGEDRIGPGLVLAGMAVMIVAGFYPGSRGVDDPALRWLIGALLAPLVASVFALLFFFLLGAARRGVRLRGRETSVMLLAAALVVVLQLPVGGRAGEWLAAASGWTLGVPIDAVFRGLLIGIGIATAVSAARILIAVDGAADD